MDEALRRLERGDDAVAYAAALRRAGDEVRARRALEAATRKGHADARAALDAWWPLDPRVERVVAAAFADETSRRWSNVRTALVWLLADEDPRLELTIARLTAALLDETGVPVDSAGWRDDERVIAAARGDFEARRCAALERAGEGLPLRCLARARLDASEVERLRGRCSNDDLDPFTRRLLLAATLWHAGRVGSVDLLRTYTEEAEFCVSAEATAWLDALDPATSPHGVAPVLLKDGSRRPATAPTACPVETRDALTGAFDRAAFVGDPAAPLVSDAPRHAPMTDWILDIDVDGMRRTLDVHGIAVGDRVLVEVTSLLQRCVGDRVARWAGDEWLIRLEPDVDALAVAEALREAVRAHEVALDDGGPAVRVTVSIGVARADTWAQAIIRASTAMALAAQEGGDVVRQAL